MAYAIGPALAYRPSRTFDGENDNAETHQDGDSGTDCAVRCRTRRERKYPGRSVHRIRHVLDERLADTVERYDHARRADLARARHESAVHCGADGAIRHPSRHHDDHVRYTRR